MDFNQKFEYGEIVIAFSSRKQFHMENIGLYIITGFVVLRAVEFVQRFLAATSGKYRKRGAAKECVYPYSSRRQYIEFLPVKQCGNSAGLFRPAVRDRARGRRREGAIPSNRHFV